MPAGPTSGSSAGYLTGSHAAGTADAHSDVDLCVVAADGQRDAVWADREVLVRRLGDPLQIEDFDENDTVFFILADGMDGELTVTDAGALPQSSRGPHRAIHDPDGILAGVAFVGREPYAGRAGRAAPAPGAVVLARHGPFHRGHGPRAVMVGGGPARRAARAIA